MWPTRLPDKGVNNEYCDSLAAPDCGEHRCSSSNGGHVSVQYSGCPCSDAALEEDTAHRTSSAAAAVHHRRCGSPAIVALRSVSVHTRVGPPTAQVPARGQPAHRDSQSPATGRRYPIRARCSIICPISPSLTPSSRASSALVRTPPSATSRNSFLSISPPFSS